METAVLRRVREQIAKEKLLAQGSKAVVGLSGGSDSLCLLLLLRELSKELSLSLCAVHVNHGIRGEAADRDEAFCAALCRRLAVDFRSVKVNVPALAAERGTGLEETGRTERYRIFAEIATEIGADCVAVAHHADDNAETILLHLVRGSGLRGLTGIPAESMPFPGKSIRLIRPLLSVTKQDILDELALRGEPWCEDATNYENDSDRNLLRNRVMPLLRELNPRAGEHIASAGEHLTAAWRLLDEQAAAAYSALCGGAKASLASGRPGDGSVSRGSRGLALDADGLLALPEALRGEVAMRYLATVCGRRKDLTDEHAAMVLRLCAGAVSAEASFPYGVTLVRGYHCIYEKPAKEEFAGRHEIARRELERGVKLTFYGERPRVLSFAVQNREQSKDFPENEYTKRFDYDTIGKACVVRTRRPGDRIAVTADGHTKTVQDVFVNRKFPRGERDALPLVLTADESAVIWIPGVRGNEVFRETAETKRVLVITMTEL